ncbi:MAG TPA: metallophosphoesterase [Polyangiaceae bacterium]|nr:metallophosphoesterase [Polyangiaceae bacterium]
MSDSSWRRRDFLTLGSLGGLVFASGLGCGHEGAPAQTPQAAVVPPSNDFFFLQLSDTHWGFSGPANPEAGTCLKRTVQGINAVEAQPELVVFTGDLTHKTDDAAQRRDRMAEFHEIARGLRAQKVIFLPGEHDAAGDAGEAYHAEFGALYQSFQHRGLRFVALDNASAPGGALGDAQLAWLEKEVAAAPATAPLVVLAHRPLFELYPQWEWSTTDGARAIELLSRHPNVTVFYGHIHQEHHQMTGQIAHHAARSLVFPLPAPGAVPQKAPLAWDPASHDHGLGHRRVQVQGAELTLTELPFVDAGGAATASAPSGPSAPQCHGTAPSYAREVEPILKERCYGCHTGNGSGTEGLQLGPYEHAFGARAEIYRQVGAHAMPPSSAKALSAGEAELLLRWAACAGS